MSIINLFEVIRDDLDSIQDEISMAVTFQFLPDTAIQNTYGFPTKDPLSISTTVIGSPVKHDESLEGKGIDEASNFRIMVHRLVSGGIDYIENEYFSRTNPDNIRVIIENRIYQVVSKRAHTSIQAESTPYWVVELSRWMDVDE